MPRRRVVLSALTAVLIWVLDRGSKIWAVRHLTENHSTDIWGSWLAWTLHHNTGAAFGLGAHAPQVLLFFAVGLTLFLAVWWFRTVADPGRRTVESFALALILGGSAGNLTDRFMTGAVIDFIDFKIWPIFNLADSAITAGAFLWALCVLAGRRPAARGSVR